MEFSFNPWLAFGWSLIAGFLMAMGAGGGGILAGIGHISVLGIGDPNMIKVVNQILELISRCFSVPIYHRQKRLVWPLAISFGVGAPLGAIAGSWFSRGYMSDMTIYRPVFGLLVVLVAGRILYEGWAKRARRNEGLNRASAASQRMQQASRATGRMAPGPSTTAFSLIRITVRYSDEEFSFNPLAAAAGGFAISFLGSSIGVGGGFLVTPFMASVLLFPMFLVLGTSLVALVLPLAASIFTYLVLSVHVDWALVGIEGAGVALGSIAGPLLNRRMNEKVLKTFVAAVLMAIGLYYLL